MRLGTYWLLISFVAAASAAGLVLLLMPTGAWSAISVFASAVFVLSIAAAFLLPFSKSRDANLGLIGPVGIFGGIFVFSSFITMLISVLSPVTWAYVFNILNVALGLIGFLIIGGASKIIQREIARNDTKGFQSRVSFDLMQLSLKVDDTGVKKKISSLSENLRFAPRAIATDKDQSQLQVDAMLDALRRSILSNDASLIQKSIEDLSAAIDAYTSQTNHHNSKA